MTTQMLINYAPSEACRVAIVADGKLEEYHAEPTDRVSRVNNVYVGRVTNVEPAIQAAFVDFGIEDNGFLHISDLHPMYFPKGDDETTERVGKKTPRRERPPIQACLKRGQEIIVQVIKEGVGTKGPTLTSYLSVPGRFLVMMPQMDRVGVSRKVEDEETRKKMRDILAQLDLPEGFGFILRTAGFDRTKAELTRDLKYLLRLWKDMERRRKGGSKPRLLYSESDLLVRALRDLMTSEIDQVVIDHPAALARGARFMKIVAPRAAAKLVQYTGEAPMLHAFGIEQQILTMHLAEVPLPSGGALVIQETEALVAIDVNSGKSRSARDAETNAYKTNLEAVDEICRQLRLRDLGGLVINDLIDMRQAKHRKEVEARFRERLKRDRAKSTILPISNFGILEMTRQRMRASHARTHFVECPTCRGRGLVQRPTSVASDGLRELAALAAHPKIAKIEMVVSARIAGELLSARRRALTRLEHTTGKEIEVRVSDAAPVDRISFYAYDKTGADINLDKLPKPKAKPPTRPWTEIAGDDDWAVDPAAEAEAEKQMLAEPEPPANDDELFMGDDDDDAQDDQPKKKRRRRRRGRRRAGDDADTPAGEGAAQSDDAAEPTDTPPPTDDEATAPSSDAPGDEDDATEGSPGRSKRRRRRRRRSTRTGEEQTSQSESDPASPTEPSADHADPINPEQPARDEPAAAPTSDAANDPADADEDAPPRPTKKKSRRGRRGRGKGTGPAAESTGEPAEPEQAGDRIVEPAPPAKTTKKTSRKTTKKTAKKTSKKTTKKAASRADAPARVKRSSIESAPADASSPNATASAAASDGASAPRKSLYSSRRKLAPSERARSSDDR